MDISIANVPTEWLNRYNRIKAAFQQKYGSSPQLFARAPARVNLIGEHIDYCGYGVLPMAIEQDIVMAVASRTDSKLNFANTNQQLYSDFAGDISQIVIDASAPQWYHYILCGVQGVLEQGKKEEAVGMDVMVDGTVPRCAGLSSSSALVCCAAMAIMRANGQQFTRVELAEICQHCERYIGTEGGGMDQAISMLAQSGSAKFIEFQPLRSTDVRLPAGCCFVISNSCSEINKAATAHFNTRVAECRLAAQVMAQSCGLSWQSIRTLGQLQQELKVTLPDMVNFVMESLHSEAYSKEEICEILGVTSEELNDISLSQKTWDVNTFHLSQRALHVYSEANRVHVFKSICDSQSESAIQELGALMYKSHQSCKDQYECSCSELDQLVQLAKSSGAHGSRLTGAGWGGCAVSLVSQDHVTTFLEHMKEGYYSKDPALSIRVDEALFATGPGGGAMFYHISE